ncbi:CRISPR system precrRNA processing endoribonuclease RAMP protein Cas6 [Paenibacillus sp. IB182496]|uniref:CRISPR system precrRNA processing endoribonuclease RAMP protein Cas6 n=1 Tax=Paenibacillus sabuli TaxID=2772509 RepID=A0A927GSZ1_9BACL|nr:CRISPR system precrRNA processing endoribonuclease RAMP protein Cas6 [Paenibacillus sabuli]MBD2847068.1 CRISPR system precrRNA processing endoribonuclease RAMP protein Cas6 [Paenibacillus sabuli]
MFGHIETLTLRASFACETEGKLPPYLGSTLRGVLGHSMRDFVCPTPDVRCYVCQIAQDCAYARNFASPGHDAGAVNAYVLYPHVRDKIEWKKGDQCTFEMTLIGSAVREAGFYVDGLQAMGERGWGAERLRFRLEQISVPERDALIWSGGRIWMRNLMPQPLTMPERRARTALVRFVTPTRILVRRKLSRRIAFEELIHSISRRLTLLSKAYTGQELQWDEDAMLEAARMVQTVEQSWRDVDFERYSMTRGGKLELPAIEGWARYEGDLTSFTPLLEAGRRLHAGKNSTIGFGRYEVFYDA